MYGINDSSGSTVSPDDMYSIGTLNYLDKKMKTIKRKTIWKNENKIKNKTKNNNKKQNKKKEQKKRKKKIKK